MTGLLVCSSSAWPLHHCQIHLPYMHVSMAPKMPRMPTRASFMFLLIPRPCRLNAGNSVPLLWPPCSPDAALSPCCRLGFWWMEKCLDGFAHTFTGDLMLENGDSRRLACRADGNLGAFGCWTTRHLGAHCAALATAAMMASMFAPCRCVLDVRRQMSGGEMESNAVKKCKEKSQDEECENESAAPSFVSFPSDQRQQPQVSLHMASCLA